MTDFYFSEYLCGTKSFTYLNIYMQEKIIILDFGSQTTQLIARRVRELNTYCEIVPYNKFPHGDESVKRSYSFRVAPFLFMIRVHSR